MAERLMSKERNISERERERNIPQREEESERERNTERKRSAHICS